MKKMAEQDASSGSRSPSEVEDQLFDIKRGGCWYIEPMNKSKQEKLQTIVEELLRTGAITKAAVYKEANIHIKEGKKLHELSRKEYGLAITLYNAVAESVNKELKEVLKSNNN